LTLTDALRTTSGITFGAGEGGNPAGDRPIIRGFNAESDVFIDGLRDVATQTREMFNVEQVEVSKGPGSAYTGAGSTGGSLNLITKTAKRQNFLDASQTFGSDQTHRTTLDGNYQFSDQVAGRLNLVKHDANVAGRDGVDVSRWGVAPSITFGFDTPTRATLSYYHLETDDTPDYGLPLTGTATSAQRRPANVNKSNFYGSSLDYRDSTTDSGTFKLEHDLNDNLTLTNTFRLVRTTLDYIVTTPDDSKGNVDQGYVYRSMKSRNSTSEGWVNQTSLRALFDTGPVAHTLVTGVEFSYEDIHNRPYAFSGNGSGNCLKDMTNCTSLYEPTYKDGFIGSVTNGKAFIDTDTKTAGAYVFDTLKFNDQWSLNLGLRYDNFKTTSSGYSNGSATTGQKAGNFNFENQTNFLSYQSGLVFNPLPNGSIYLAWSTSTNPIGETSGSGGQDISFTTQDLKPERNRNTELGTKWDFFHERLRLEAAVFKTDKTNARINDANGLPQNIGETEVRGFELGASGKLTDKWQMFASYTYLDSEIKKGLDQGNHVPSAPENSLSLWTTYSVLPDLTIGGGANYVDSRYGNTANTIEVPSYWRYDAMAGYRLSKNLDVQLNVQNLTDERYFDQVYTNHMAHVAPGRTYLLSTNFHF
jgi:catecholate siderophore receptor